MSYSRGSHACTGFLPVEPCRLQVDWSIRTLALTYWMDYNDPLFCQVALVLNRLYLKRIVHIQPGCQLGMMQQTL